MKHIFTIHSPLTFLVAYSVIRHLDLNQDNVILLSNRYKVPIEGWKVYPSFAEKFANHYLNKIYYLNVPRSFDNYITKITGGDEYTAYVDLMSYEQKILVTHQNCRQFHFIEEGNSTYMAEDDLADLTWIDYLGGMKFRNQSYFSKSFVKSLSRVIRGYNVRLTSLPYHYMAYVNYPGIRFFVFSNNAFYHAPSEKKVMVCPDQDDKGILYLAKGLALKDAVIWIDGSNARYTGLDERYYYDATQKAVEVLAGKGLVGNEIYLKMRPGSVLNAGHPLTIAANKCNIKVELLPGDVSIESLFITSSDCVVVGVLSAALEYAHIFGHQSYSIYSLFELQPPTFFDRMEGFWQNVKKL